MTATPSRIIRNTLDQVKKALILGALIGLAPAHLAAQVLTCNPSIDVTILGGTVFLLNEPVRISADIGAGLVETGDPDTNFLDIDKITFLMDCSGTDTFPDCTDGGNTIVYANNISTDCQDSMDNPVVFDATVDMINESIEFTPMSGLPVRNDSNETCNLQFDVVVEEIADDNPEATVVNILGWLDAEARCGDDTGNVAGTALQISFDISTRNANFRVTKDFSDDNPLGVNVALDCNTGLILDQEKVIFDQPGDFVNFVVTKFRAGELSCHVTEDPVPVGYSESYAAGSEGGVAVTVEDDAEGCHFLEVTEGQFTCDITNELDPLTVTVNKRWIGDFVEQGFSREASAFAECFNVRDGAGLETINERLYFSGDSSDTIMNVFPDYDGTTYCVVEEADVDSAVISDASDCANVPVTAESSRECTIYNTLFFEGIPTLSQYGLAVLALLMLGIGMLSFRRFA